MSSGSNEEQIDFLALVASSDFANYDPGALATAVNRLLPLGAPAALDAVERQLGSVDRIVDPQHGLFLVLRMLFDVPEGEIAHPPMRIGIPDVMQPVHAEAAPRFPLIVVDDVPLLLVTTFMLGGSPQPVESHIEHFRKGATLREQPLTPSLDAADVLAGFVTRYTDAYDTAPTETYVGLIRQQLDRMSANLA